MSALFALVAHPAVEPIFALIRRHHGVTHLLGLAIKTFIVLAVIVLIIIVLIIYALKRVLGRGRRERGGRY